MTKYIAVLLLLANFSFAQTNNFDLPVITESVNDLEDILSASEEDELRDLIKIIFEQKEIAIAIVSVKSIEPFESMLDYSLALANRSTKGQIIIVVCAAIEAGQIQIRDNMISGLTDDESSRILAQYILTEFKKGNHFDGLTEGIREIAKEF